MEKIFNELNTINVNDHTEEKNGLTYLSWSWSWSELKKKYPTATYTIERFGEEKKPYLYDEELGYMVFTTMTINGLTHEMWLPVMDGANKSMRNKPYTYKVKKWNNNARKYDYVDKTVEPATMFDINKTIMRCLVKNISMFGLGLYIYSGEDLPEELDNEETEKVSKPQKKQQSKEASNDDKAKLLVEIQEFYKSHKEQYGKIIKATLNHNQVEKISDLPIGELQGLVEFARSGKHSLV